MEHDKITQMNVRKNSHLTGIKLKTIRLFKPPTLTDAEIADCMQEAGKLWRCPEIFTKYEKINLLEVADLNTDGKNVFWDEDESYRKEVDDESGEWINRCRGSFIGMIEANKDLLKDIITQNGKQAAFDLIKQRGIPKMKVAGILASYISLLNSWALYEIFPFIPNPNAPLLRLIDGGYLPRHYKHGWVLIFANPLLK